MRIPLLFVDLAAGDGEAARHYTAARLRQFSQRLGDLAGRPVGDGDVWRELAREADDNGTPQTSFASDSTGPAGTPAVLAWAEDRPASIAAARELGFTPAWFEGEFGYAAARSSEALPVAESKVWEHLARRHQISVRTSARHSLHHRAEALLDAAARIRSVDVLLFDTGSPDVDAWQEAVLRRLAREETRVHRVSSGRAESGPSDAALARPARTSAPPPPRPRAVKQLAVAATFGDHQRAWFADVQHRAAQGEPFAVVNADAPQEVLRALEIPFVVNQWWASIAAAKGGAARSRAALAAAGLPTRHETYNSQGIADLLAGPEGAPWGGLPRPRLLEVMRNDDAVSGVYEEWARRTDAAVLWFDRTIESRERFPARWWELMPDHWEETLEPERLELTTAQLRESIVQLEKLTGRVLDPVRLREVLDLVNEQEEWYRRTRDLIAAAHPAPVGIVDTIPATMIPQWHRGTEWGRDAAKAFHDEVLERVTAGRGVCDRERFRLMWVGRGLWQHMWLYQRFERSHGAVFIWSMYLGLAADGYIRRMKADQDPLRALAARFVTVGDELRMPEWAAAWHVAEARRHGVHAAIAVDDAEAEVLRALERSGIPVLRIAASNLVDDVDGIEASIEMFLDGLSDGRAEPLQ